jgi:poly(rC)-binding protein 2/3/4
MIRISNCEDRDAPANLDRTITISGNCESVALAQYLINMRCVPLACSAPDPGFATISWPTLLL